MVGIRDPQGRWREYDPERDLLPRLDWHSFRFRHADQFVANRTVRETTTTVAIHDVRGAMGMTVDTRSQELGPLIAPTLAPAVGYLLDVVPNVWHATRLLRNAEAEIIARGIPAERVASARSLLSDLIRTDIEQQVDAASEAIFRALILTGDVALVARSNGLGVPLPDFLTVPTGEHDGPLTRRDGTPFQKHAFQTLFGSSVNMLERAVIRELDEMDRLKWWHRVQVQQEWSLVGWRRNRIYPDLVAGIDGSNGPALIALESKGAHLAGNSDTEYKRSVFGILGVSYSRDGVPGETTNWRARILQDPGWEADLIAALDC